MSLAEKRGNLTFWNDEMRLSVVTDRQPSSTQPRLTHVERFDEFLVAESEQGESGRDHRRGKLRFDELTFSFA